MKKFAALLAALVLCFALCISAAAYNASEILNTSNASTGTVDAACGKTTVTAETYPAGTTFTVGKDVPGKYFSEFQVYDDADNYVGYYFPSSAFTLPDDGKVYRLSVFDGSSFVFYDTYVTAGTGAAAEPEAPLYTKYQYKPSADASYFNDCYVITGTSTEAPKTKTFYDGGMGNSSTFTATFSDVIDYYILAGQVDPESTVKTNGGFVSFYKWNGTYFENMGFGSLPSGEYAAKEAFVYNGQTADMIIPEDTSYTVCITLKGAKFDAAAPETPAAPAEPVVSFTDIKEGETFYDAIAYVTKQNLMDGATETAFQRKAAATNKTVLDTIAKLTGADAAKAWAAQQGLTETAEAVREDLITMLWIANGKKAADESVLAKFADADAISDESKTAMAWAVETGLVQGYANGLLGAQSQLTRGAMAAILFRAAV